MPPQSRNDAGPNVPHFSIPYHYGDPAAQALIVDVNKLEAAMMHALGRGCFRNNEGRMELIMRLPTAQGRKVMEAFGATVTQHSSDAGLEQVLRNIGTQTLGNFDLFVARQIGRACYAIVGGF